MESTSVVDALGGPPSSLAAALAQVPDPRRAASVVYPVAAMLALAVAALLANHLLVLAIAEWGAPRRSDVGDPGLSAQAHALPIDAAPLVSPA